MWKPYEDKGKLEEILALHPGDEWWRGINGSNDLDEFKRWLKEKDIPLKDAFQALREAMVKRQANNTPDLLLETRSLAKKYGFGDDPEGFFAEVNKE